MELANGLIHAVRIKQQEVVESMVAGRFVNFESYQRYVGIHQGLEEALVILNNLLEEKDRNDNEL
jgi:hypothetical protein